jgi:hypothetical protein
LSNMRRVRGQGGDYDIKSALSYNGYLALVI